ncbi:MAG: bifunctional precorrin-2 dehydrogenase/sirohydrochlorin ferrochelatase [Deltaproteobacteria bacterium]|nr:bifunctional precorrin-2 dehydrogenase/sirohydrochlorin ferrochelatase [Deltaproteobacteria bacterium]NCP03386.1 bifunctional precorrin-2 dehydrogenase/sirohydrochlorin ferrochelatase [Deltaproteobacteria bacterium]NCP77904.1 bifunctional precorrin-2 dehydrogenase/sirohydrochlorin ferrochelatase [Desulfuromonadales bacterium]
MASDLPSTQESNPGLRPGYPIELKLEQQLVVFIGGGRVARRKLGALYASGAQIKVIDPAKDLNLSPHRQLTWIERAYQPGDLDGARLVFAATNDTALNTQVAADCARRGILCSRVDAGLSSVFTLPAHLYRAPLHLSVSSSGQCPAIAALLRDHLATQLSPAWQTLAQLAAVIRQKVLTEKLNISYNQQVFLRMLNAEVLKHIEQADTAALNHLLFENFGSGFSLSELKFSLPEGST